MAIRPQLGGLDTFFKLSQLGPQRAQSMAGLSMNDAGGSDIAAVLRSGWGAGDGMYEDEDTPAFQGDATGVSDLDPQLLALTKQFVSGEEPLSREDKMLALAQAGFGMAAGQSPSALANIGAGAQEGISALMQLRQQRALQRMREIQAQAQLARAMRPTNVRMSPLALMQKERDALVSEFGPDDPRVKEITALITKQTTADAGGQTPVFQQQIAQLMKMNQEMTEREATDIVLRQSEERTNRPQQGPLFRLPDGQAVPTMFNPAMQRYEYRDASGAIQAVPFGADPTTAGVGSPLNRVNFEKKENEFLTETEGLRKLDSYLGTVESADQGFGLLADKIAAQAKTAFDSGKLDAEQFATLEGRAKLQSLLGMLRVDVVGPGAMTEYDAQRVLDALGGDIGLLRNKDIVRSTLQSVYEQKRRRAAQFRDQLLFSASAYGKAAEDYEIPEPVNFKRTVNNGAPKAKDGTVVTDVDTSGPPTQLPADRAEATRIYNALPSGAKYIDPSGQKRTKP